MKKFNKVFPTLETKRLILTQQNERFIPQMVKLANSEEIAKNLSSMPYPYKEADAKKFVENALKEYKEGEMISFAITDRESGEYMGNVDLDFSIEHNHATLGYWIGKPYWGKGYMSEAALEVVRYGFEVLGLKRVASHHFHTNPASGKVLEKIGMKLEGVRRAHFKKGDEYLDIHDFGILNYRTNI